eukprot:CAMPEP_0194049736 /NCGR_PEP_ID=MMETSP0009_2-20130614/30865_1 /TAXON_ID=210454 /ORGANISM="Grammatophora oceanica, Strain CCMP 410" /LENGTH=236 /DNA_ID=CAMNT_0038695955 /DNA_START=22 /DNA_END=732 /DNA_ORIENTATION=-
MMKLLTGLLLVVGARGFVTPSAPAYRSKAARNMNLMNDMDTTAILNVADLCTEDLSDECDLDERDALINTLESQIEILKDRVVELDQVIQDVKSISHHEVMADDVKSLFKSIQAVLNVESKDMGLPSLAPRVYSSNPRYRRMLSTTDLVGMVNVAEYCLAEDGICDAEQHEAILNTLSEQRELASGRVAEMRSSLASLGHVAPATSSGPHRDPVAVQSLLHSIEHSLSKKEAAPMA